MSSALYHMFVRKLDRAFETDHVSRVTLYKGDHIGDTDYIMFICMIFDEKQQNITIY